MHNNSVFKLLVLLGLCFGSCIKVQAQEQEVEIEPETPLRKSLTARVSSSARSAFAGVKNHKLATAACLAFVVVCSLWRRTVVQNREKLRSLEAAQKSLEDKIVFREQVEIVSELLFFHAKDELPEYRELGNMHDQFSMLLRHLVGSDGVLISPLDEPKALATLHRFNQSCATSDLSPCIDVQKGLLEAINLVLARSTIYLDLITRSLRDNVDRKKINTACLGISSARAMFRCAAGLKNVAEQMDNRGLWQDRSALAKTLSQYKAKEETIDQATDKVARVLKIIAAREAQAAAAPTP